MLVLLRLPRTPGWILRLRAQIFAHWARKVAPGAVDWRVLPPRVMGMSLGAERGQIEREVVF